MPLLVKISKRKQASYALREGISDKTGKPYKIITQQISVIFDEDDAETYTVTLPENTPPYLQGNYVWPVEEQLLRGNWDSVRTGPAVLIPLKDYKLDNNFFLSQLQSQFSNILKK